MEESEIITKKKPEKTTISISGSVSERLEAYCRVNNILRKDFVELALKYFERTGYDLRSDQVDYSPMEKMINSLESVKDTMESSLTEKAAIATLLQAVREQTQKQLLAPDVIAQAGAEKAEAEQTADSLRKELSELREKYAVTNSELAASNSKIESVRSELEQSRKSHNDTQSAYDTYKAGTEAQIEALNKELAELRKYKEEAHAEFNRIREEESYFTKIKVRPDL